MDPKKVEPFSVEKLKEYLSENRHKTKLNDLINGEVNSLLSMLNSDNLNLAAPGVNNIEAVSGKLKEYEAAIQGLQKIVISLSYWGNQEQKNIISEIFSGIYEQGHVQAGSKPLSALSGYPLINLFYLSGISALASQNYPALEKLFMARSNSAGNVNEELIAGVGRIILEIDRSHVFSNMPDYKKYHVPRSIYLHEHLQPLFDEPLISGGSYHKYFDKFEVFMALIHADLCQRNTGKIWGPYGIFVCKYHETSTDNPLKDVINEAGSFKNEWPLLKAGFFNGSYERFTEICSKYIETFRLLQWYYEDEH